MRRLALIALLAVPLTGCTAAEDEPETSFRGPQAEVAKVVEDLEDAGAKGDENAICEDIIASELRERILRAGAKDCVSAMEDVLGDADSFDLDVRRVTVDGTRATAVVRSDGRGKDRTDTLRLVRERGGWRVAALGG